ncbi:MAG: transcriptional regulator [Hyphomicrobiales bacterium]|nr:MAG: transcriptional regulator [Hyphomicrobiales bacterium]
MNGIQCRMARAALGMTVKELAAQAEVATDTVVRFEGGQELKGRTVAAIRAALEDAGVIFVDENGEGPGVRLKKIRQDNAAPTIPLEDLNAENDE